MNNRIKNPLRLKWNDDLQISKKLLDGAIGTGPTETVPGFLGIPSTQKAINTLKNSPLDKALITLIGEAELAYDIWGLKAESLEQLIHLWPAPLTIIAGKNGGRAVRMPKCQKLLNLLKKTGPLLSTSANLSGEPTVKSMDQLSEKLLSNLDFIIDEPCPDQNSLASTIIKVQDNSWQMIREGAFESHLLPQEFKRS